MKTLKTRHISSHLIRMVHFYFSERWILAMSDEDQERHQLREVSHRV